MCLAWPPSAPPPPTACMTRLGPLPALTARPPHPPTHTAGGFTCKEHERWGKCGAVWMVEGAFCAATCGRCAGGGSSAYTAAEQEAGAATNATAATAAAGAGTTASSSPSPSPFPTPTPPTSPFSAAAATAKPATATPSPAAAAAGGKEDQPPPGALSDPFTNGTAPTTTGDAPGTAPAVRGPLFFSSSLDDASGGDGSGVQPARPILFIGGNAPGYNDASSGDDNSTGAGGSGSSPIGVPCAVCTDQPPQGGRLTCRVRGAGSGPEGGWVGGERGSSS